MLMEIFEFCIMYIQGSSADMTILDTDGLKNDNSLNNQIQTY